MKQPNRAFYYIEDWLEEQAAAELYRTLLKEVDWQRESISMFGREVVVPRLVSFCGDRGRAYRYSGVDHVCQGWLASLDALRLKLQDEGFGFNFVLLNYYRDGKDYMGWHSDDEAALGKEPRIGSLSLGAARDFVLRERSDPQRKHLFHLKPGSLLVMQGDCQSRYQHSLPKRLKVKEGRINLTFRSVN